jgi:hypothetical protein
VISTDHSAPLYVYSTVLCVVTKFTVSVASVPLALSILQLWPISLSSIEPATSRIQVQNIAVTLTCSVLNNGYLSHSTNRLLLVMAPQCIACDVESTFVYSGVGVHCAISQKVSGSFPDVVQWSMT